MKTLWSIISFLAIVNLLALLMFVGWLWQSGRLTAERVNQTRELFALTDQQAKEALTREAEVAKAEVDRQAQEEEKAHPSLDSIEQVRTISLIRREQEQARRRLDDEKAALLAQLATANTTVEQKAADLDRRRSEWENMVREDRQRKTDEQFLQAVRQLEQVSPKQGKQIILELVKQKQMDTAITYLDSMNARAAGKIFKEFKSDSEVALATQLLERLRTFGNTPAPTAGSSESAAAGDSSTPPSPGPLSNAARQPSYSELTHAIRFDSSSQHASAVTRRVSDRSVFSNRQFTPRAELPQYAAA